jgi:hydrogenase maturation protease
MNTLIIGVGNALRGDDGVGQRAALALEQRLAGGDVEVIACTQLTPELCQQIAQAALVIFIDAMIDGEAGSIHIEKLRPKAPSTQITHHLCPSALLASALALYGHAPAAVQFTVSGRAFGLTERLSAPVARALPRLIDAVARVASPSAMPTLSEPLA